MQYYYIITTAAFLNALFCIVVDNSSHVPSDTIQFTLHRDDSGGRLHVTSASLYMLLRYSRHDDDNDHQPCRVTLSIYALEGDRLITSKGVVARHTRWQKLILPTTLIQGIFDSSSRTLRVRIHCDSCGRNVTPLFATKYLSQQKRKRYARRGRSVPLRKLLNKRRPFLVINTAKSDPPRDTSKRSVGCESNSRKCCKKSLYVSFAELGWDHWVIAPEGYFANYCNGKCNVQNLPGGFNSPHSSVLSHYTNSDGLQQENIELCCSPRKMTSLSLLYFDDSSNIVRSDVPDMVVEDCGCA